MLWHLMPFETWRLHSSWSITAVSNKKIEPASVRLGSKNYQPHKYFFASLHLCVTTCFIVCFMLKELFDSCTESAHNYTLLFLSNLPRTYLPVAISTSKATAFFANLSLISFILCNSQTTADCVGNIPKSLKVYVIKVLSETKAFLGRSGASELKWKRLSFASH